MRGRREKVFGEGRPVPLDRNAKVRIAALARALSRRTEPGRHYGVLTAKFVAVLNVLLWGFHNAHSGRCFPSYDAIAERAGCARSTVYEALKALEEAGILTWVHRIRRVRETVTDLFGRREGRWRVLRTSNSYAFVDPGTRAGGFSQEKTPRPSKSENPTGTPLQVYSSYGPSPVTGLDGALARWGSAIKGGRDGLVCPSGPVS